MPMPSSASTIAILGIEKVDGGAPLQGCIESV
jgi:hypothetical protein